MKSIAIVGIGKNYQHQMQWILDAESIPEWIKIEICKDNYKHYDMFSMPENGDVIDHLNEHSAVVGIHLYFDLPHPHHDYFYNRENEQLIKKAFYLEIPVYLAGDQPNPGTQTNHGWKSYNDQRIGNYHSSKSA